MNKEELLGVLRESKIFKDISDGQLNEIVSHGEIMHFGKHDLLLEEGQVKNSLCVVLDGQVEVFLPKTRSYASEARPTKIVLDRFSQGDCAGEYSLIDNEPASASVMATEPCSVLRLTRNEFEALLNSDTELEKTIYKNMLKILIYRCRKSDNELDICY